MSIASDKIREVLRDRPAFHRSETEIARRFSANESLLRHDLAERLASQSLECHGLNAETLDFLSSAVNDSTHSLEIGAGCSTLLFAINGATHTVVTPGADEIQRITDYAAQKEISLERVTFQCESSDKYLPKSTLQDLDIVLIDGKHAFPWP